MEIGQVKHMISGVGEGIAPDDDWMPTLIYETKDGKVTVVGMAVDLVTQTDRNIVAHMIKTILRQADAVAAVWVVTAWSVDSRSLTKEEMDYHMEMARQHKLNVSAKKVECVVAIIAHRNPTDGPNTVITGRILRSAEYPKLDWDWLHLDDDSKPDAMMGIFPDAVLEGISKGGGIA